MYADKTLCFLFWLDGIAAGFALSLMNYLLLGWAADVDGFYLHSFEIWLACMVVFPGAGNLGYTLLEYRLGHRPLLDSLWENMTWVPFLYVFLTHLRVLFFSSCAHYLHSFFFFGGLSIHLSQALLAHLFSYNITWGATKKEVERSNFWLEVPKIVRRFWLALIISIITAVGMAVLATDLIPVGWRIPGIDWAVVFPLSITIGCHVLYPVRRMSCLSST